MKTFKCLKLPLTEDSNPLTLVHGYTGVSDILALVHVAEDIT